MDMFTDMSTVDVHRVLLSWALIFGAACAAQTGRSDPAPRSSHSSAANQAIRALSILPKSARTCVGQPIQVQYIARLADGSRIPLSATDVTPVGGGVDAAAQPRSDGTWQTSIDPMRSVLAGFRLAAALTRDSSVRGDTVIAPSYECSHMTVALPASDRYNSAEAHVRLGVFATPFYDSVVVAVVEVDGRPPTVMVLAPSEMRSSAIKIQASGKPGAPGRAGRPGAEGASCANGEQGEDGEAGEPGQPGGRVDIIVQDGSPWLANLVAVANLGGHGGAGGPGGLGGRPGVGARQGGTTCNIRAGRSGRPGQPGADGPAGPPPRVTSVISPLLWPGSPIWSDPIARSAIEGLMKYEPKRRG
jgi:hypothetical protein